MKTIEELAKEHGIVRNVFLDAIKGLFVASDYQLEAFRKACIADYFESAELAAYMSNETKALTRLLKHAVEDIESWAGYASPYFQEKHDLQGCLKGYRDAIPLPAAMKGE